MWTLESGNGCILCVSFSAEFLLEKLQTSWHKSKVCNFLHVKEYAAFLPRLHFAPFSPLSFPSLLLVPVAVFSSAPFSSSPTPAFLFPFFLFSFIVPSTLSFRLLPKRGMVSICYCSSLVMIRCFN